MDQETFENLVEEITAMTKARLDKAEAWARREFQKAPIPDMDVEDFVRLARAVTLEKRSCEARKLMGVPGISDLNFNN